MADDKDGQSGGGGDDGVGGVGGGDKGEEVGPQRPSDGDRTRNGLVLEQDADHQEDKVEHEHDEAEQLAHAPFAGSDGDDDKEEHEEEEHDGTEEAVGADLHRAHAVEEGPEEPGEGQSANTHKYTLYFLATQQLVLDSCQQLLSYCIKSVMESIHPLHIIYIQTSYSLVHHQRII